MQQITIERPSTTKAAGGKAAVPRLDMDYVTGLRNNNDQRSSPKDHKKYQLLRKIHKHKKNSKSEVSPEASTVLGRGDP